ncbi:MAG: hypothetical protein E2P02_05430 [Acidobacteria bacterium]|nr:MAG: hypothetical protein E2P02_05430 [Acidobacteriota bacterium]
MHVSPLRGARVVLLEPDINPITRRFGLPKVASYPPLAQVRLAGQIDGGGVEVVDLRIPGETKRFLRTLSADPPALVGISLTFTSNGEEALQIASAIKSASPDTLIVLGGTGASEDQDSFWESDIDFIAFRRADASFPLLVREIRERGRAPEAPLGFCHRKDGAWVRGDDVEAPPMAKLRPYAWHLLPRRYWRRYFQGFRPTGMGQTSEGCPFDCTFCSVWKIHGREVSVASLANIQHDLMSLPSFARNFFFADDIWMQASERQRQELYDPLLDWVASELLPERPDLWLTVETRTDLFLRQDARFKDWIKRGGLMRILFGVEAATNEQLDIFSKRVTMDENSLAIQKAAEWGAFVTAQFVIPCDADRQYFDELVRFLEAHRPWIRVSNFTIATPLPGTELYEDALAESPELADRNVVTFPAFSLFTALSPMRMDPVEYYEQVARVYKVANQVSFDWGVFEHFWTIATKSPWLLPNTFKMFSGLRGLTRGETFVRTHRDVQGDRLLGGASDALAASSPA